MQKNVTAPFVHTEKTVHDRAIEWFVALSPILVWSVFMFGARVLSLCLISSCFAVGLDYLVRRYVFKMQKGTRVDLMTAVYGILSAFMMPVAVSFFVPILASVFVVLAKNIKPFRAKHLFNPFVFSAAMLNLLCKTQMTAFTRPFAYFSAFSFSIDEKLVSGYRVISPLQYMADGSVYEDGVLAQLYGYASGCIGEIAVAAILVALIWLCIRKEADWRGTVAFLVPILLLALMYPSDDAESNYYAYSVLLSGSIVFLAAFGTNEALSVPMTKTGRYVFGFVCGVLTFILRKTSGGFEWGYIVVLVMNIVTPFIAEFTKPKVLNEKKGNNEKRRNND